MKSATNTTKERGTLDDHPANSLWQNPNKAPGVDKNQNSAQNCKTVEYPIWHLQFPQLPFWNLIHDLNILGFMAKEMVEARPKCWKQTAEPSFVSFLKQLANMKALWLHLIGFDAKTVHVAHNFI